MDCQMSRPWHLIWAHVKMYMPLSNSDRVQLWSSTGENPAFLNVQNLFDSIYWMGLCLEGWCLLSATVVCSLYGMWNISGGSADATVRDYITTPLNPDSPFLRGFKAISSIFKYNFSTSLCLVNHIIGHCHCHDTHIIAVQFIAVQTMMAPSNPW